jgi:hypothetical protein
MPLVVALTAAPFSTEPSPQQANDRKTLIAYFLPIPIVGKLSNVWGAPGIGIRPEIAAGDSLTVTNCIPSRRSLSVTISCLGAIRLPRISEPTPWHTLVAVPVD